MQSVTRLVASAATSTQGVKCFLELGLGGSSGQAQSGSSRGPPIARCPAGYGPQRQLLQQSVLQIMRHKATGFLAAARTGTAGEGEEVTDTWGCQLRTGFVSPNYCRVQRLGYHRTTVLMKAWYHWTTVVFKALLSLNYCRVQDLVSPNYCRIQSLASQNYCCVQGLVSLNYCRVQGLVSLNYCRVQVLVSPKCRVQGLVSPNYCRVQRLVSQNHCRLQGFVSPNRRVQGLVSQNYCRVQGLVSQNYCRVQGLVSQNYCSVQGFVSPNCRVQVTADGQRKVLYTQRKSNQFWMQHSHVRATLKTQKKKVTAM